MSESVRIAMWSGPRNVSTALMRAFENRADTVVAEEPFYAPYLAVSGKDHPMRLETLAAHETDPEAVVRHITGPVPGGAPIWYQKHMPHHMLDGFDLGWMAGFRNAFLVRPPEPVIASYAKQRASVCADDLGYARQRALFEAEAERLGRAPPVITGDAVRADPKRALGMLCAALGIPFDEGMLSWPAGPRDTDGAWAPVWYAAVQASTGFAPPEASPPATLPDDLAALARECRADYEALAAHAIV